MRGDFDRLFEAMRQEREEMEAEAKREAWYAALIPFEQEWDYGVLITVRWMDADGNIDPTYPGDSAWEGVSRYGGTGAGGR